MHKHQGLAERKMLQCNGVSNPLLDSALLNVLHIKTVKKAFVVSFASAAVLYYP